MKDLKQLPQKTKTLLLVAAFLLLIITLATAGAYFSWRQAGSKINPGTTVGTVNVGQLSLAEANDAIEKRLQEIEKFGLKLNYNNQEFSLPAVTSISADASLPIFTYQRDSIDNFLNDQLGAKSFWGYLKSWITPTHLDAPYILDLDLAEKNLREQLADDVIINPRDAAFEISKNDNKDWEFIIIPERIGREISFNQVFVEINQILSSLKRQNIIIKTETARPIVYATDLENLTNEALQLTSLGELTLSAASGTATSTWEIAPETIASWIAPQIKDGRKVVSLAIDRVQAYLNERIAPEINRDPAAPRYELNGHRLNSWSPVTVGQKLNTEASAAAIIDSYTEKHQTEVPLIVDLVTPEIKDGDDKLKIEEVVGIGHSNFAGSSANRRHNIKVGSDTLHGLLIAPGEEFSLIKALGNIDGKAGYRTELVIKGDKTIPEYGGGLCQVATTLFRSALSSGLPITMRQNHSYRVSYYEPAGMDAAVYDPRPDVRFINDSPNYILIQSRMEGNDLYFDFWGKSDGRNATTTTPVIFNIVKPAPTKIIETTDLKPGQKHCTESSHNGADTYFDYTVNYADGETKTERFKSHYVPWQAVCLVGASASSTEAVATSTPPEATTSPETAPSSTPPSASSTNP